MIFLAEDEGFMQRALDAALEADPQQTRTNPQVGCIVVKNQKILGVGYHQKSGEAHAEINAIEDVVRSHGSVPRESTFYITLEPCSFHGRTPPCVDALIRARPQRVVIGCRDPHPKVNGSGVELLRRAGIQVSEGVCEQACLSVNEGFFHWAVTQLPFVELKIAITADGYAASASPSRLAISSQQAQAWVHRRRQRYDGVCVGAHTLIKDQPLLDTRYGLATRRVPELVILDSSLKTPLEGPWWDVLERKVTIVTRLPGNEARLRALEKKNAHVLAVKSEGIHVDLQDAWAHLGAMGIRSLFVEAGPTLATSLLEKNGLVQRLTLLKSKNTSPLKDAQAWVKRPELASHLLDRMRHQGSLDSDSLLTLNF